MIISGFTVGVEGVGGAGKVELEAAFLLLLLLLLPAFAFLDFLFDFPPPFGLVVDIANDEGGI